MKRRVIYAIVTLVFAFSFMGCDEFFSTSLGDPRKYDSSKIDVNAGNIDEWVNTAVGNPDLAAAITEAILRELEKTKDPAAKAALLEGGVKIAVESSGLGESILTRGAELLGEADDLDDGTILDLLGKIQGDFVSGGGVQAADNIAKLVNGSIKIESGNTPVFDDEYASIAQPGDVAEAILVLVLGELNGDDVDKWDNLEALDIGLNISNGHVVIDGNPGPNAIALAAYLNLIADNPDKFTDNPLTNAIKEAFFDSM